MPDKITIITDVIIIVIMVLSYIYGRYISPRLHPGAVDQTKKALDELTLVANYADKFVIWAREFLKNKPGTEKMDEVLSKLEEVTRKYKLVMTSEQLKAIAQAAYENMKTEDKDTSAATIAEKAIDAIKETAVANAANNTAVDKVAMLANDIKVIKEEK